VSTIYLSTKPTIVLDFGFVLTEIVSYCYYNNAFCWIDYYEDSAGTKTVGGYILSLGFADFMYGVFDFGTGEVYTRLSDSPTDCERNINLKFKYYINDSTRFSLSVVLLSIMVVLALLF